MSIHSLIQYFERHNDSEGCKKHKVRPFQFTALKRYLSPKPDMHEFTNKSNIKSIIAFNVDQSSIDFLKNNPYDTSTKIDEKKKRIEPKTKHLSLMNLNDKQERKITQSMSLDQLMEVNHLKVTHSIARSPSPPSIAIPNVGQTQVGQTQKSQYQMNSLDLELLQLQQDTISNSPGFHKRKKSSMDEETISFVVAKNNMLIANKIDPNTIQNPNCISRNVQQNLLFHNNKNRARSRREKHKKLWECFKMNRNKSTQHHPMTTFKIRDIADATQIDYQDIQESQTPKQGHDLYCSNKDIIKSRSNASLASSNHVKNHYNETHETETLNSQKNKQHKDKDSVSEQHKDKEPLSDFEKFVVNKVKNHSNSSKSSSSSYTSVQTSLSNGFSIKRDIKKQRRSDIATRESMLVSVGVSDMIEDVGITKPDYATSKSRANKTSTETLKRSSTENNVLRYTRNHKNESQTTINNLSERKKALDQTTIKTLSERKKALEMYSGKGLYELIFKHEKTYHHHNKHSSSSNLSLLEKQPVQNEPVIKVDECSQTEDLHEDYSLNISNEKLVSHVDHQKKVKTSLNNFLKSSDSSTNIVNSFTEFINVSLF